MVGQVGYASGMTGMSGTAGLMSGGGGASGLRSSQKSSMPSIYTGLLNTSHFRAEMEAKKLIEEPIVKPNLQYLSMGGKKDLAPPPKRDKNKYKVILGNKTERNYADNTLLKKETQPRHTNNNALTKNLTERNNVGFFNLEKCFILLLFAALILILNIFEFL